MIRRYEGKSLIKNHCSIRKNTIRNNHFIQELTSRTPLKITNSPKNLLLRLEFIIWLCVLFSSDKHLVSINCCKTHHQPNSFTHSLINLLYKAYWAHILFYLGLGYDLWPYKFNSDCFYHIYTTYGWRNFWCILVTMKRMYNSIGEVIKWHIFFFFSKKKVLYIYIYVYI